MLLTNFTVKKLIVNPQIQLGNISGNASIKNGVFKANITNADVKEFNVNGVISLDSPKSLPYIKLNIKGNTLNIEDFTSTPKNDKRAAMDWLIPSAQASTLMNNIQIPYQYFKMANADVNLNIKNIKIDKDISVSDVLTDLTLKNGVFKADISILPTFDILK